MSGNNDGAGKHGAEANASRPNKDFLIVGLGGSAGAIRAFREFFQHVPSRSGMAYVVILHLSPDHDSQLAEVLQHVTDMPVMQVTEAVRVEPERVYVIPPNKSLSMYDGMLTLSDVAGFEERRAPVDIFFRTLADANGSRAVSVTMSGTGANGSMGLKRVKEHGGLVLAQEPSEAEFDEMPRNSVATGLVDYVLPVAEMPAKIIAYREQLGAVRRDADGADRTESEERALVEVFTQLRVRTGHDFTNYKRATVLRRVERRMGVHELPDLPSYARYMREHRQEAQALLKDLLISVTNFFRDPESFAALERNVVPLLFGSKGNQDQVRVWVAGCATGEEAYSVAMLLAERAALSAFPPNIQVFATDLDEAAVAQARAGFYTLNDVADVPPERLRQFFTKEGEGFRVRRELREMVLFAHHNLIKDPPFSHVDLITCRNLLIYLNRTAQERAMAVLHFALNPGGFLMLGSSESTEGAADLFAVFDKEAHIYRGREVAPRLPVAAAELSPSLHADRRDGREPSAGTHAAEPRAPERLTSYDMHQRLLELYGPPSVVVNGEYDIVHVSERAGRYLQVAGGEPSHNLLRVVRPELRLELRSALIQAAQERSSVAARGLVLHTGNGAEAVNLIVRPAPGEADPSRGLFLVLFEESREGGASAKPPAGETVTAAESAALRLEEENERLRLRMRVAVEQYETQAEEFKAANEELQAMNEELRSATEELETGKEELQSVNEELHTVNQELKVKVEELSQANNDFQNLIGSTEIGTVFLDRALRVKMFTPRARTLFNLIPADVGRPLSDITGHLDHDGLLADVESVVERLHTVEREVGTRDGRFYLMRLLPYRTVDDRIEGVILTFYDITERRHAEEAVRASEERLQKAINIETVGAIFFNNDIEITDCNEAFLRMSGYTRDEIKAGRFSWEAFTPEEFVEPSRRAIEELNARGITTPYEKEYIRKDGSRFWAVFAAKRISESEIVEFVTDVTEQKRADAIVRESEEKYRSLFNSIDEGFCTIEVLFDGRGKAVDYRFLETNPAFVRQTGLENAVGKTMREFAPEHEEFWFETYGRIAKTGEPVRFEHEAAALGKFYDVYAFRIGAPQENRVAVIFNDIFARKRAEEAVRQSEERLRLVVESVEDYAIFTTDTAGLILSWNPGAARAFGYTEEEAVGRNIEIIFTPEDRAADVPEKEMRRARESGRAADERWHVSKDGARFYVSGVLAPLRDGEGNLTGYAKIARDLTERKQLEDALRRAHAELEERVRGRTAELQQLTGKLLEEVKERAAAEERVRGLLRQLVTVQEEERRRIARELHDTLGQQLTGLQLSIDMISAESEGRAMLREHIARTRGIFDRLNSDVDFLAWELRPAGLDQLGLDAALRSFVREWSKHFGVKVNYHGLGDDAPRLPAEVETNLYRILQEALQNVHKHAGATHVSVILERRGGQTQLIIEDNGRGYDPEEEAAAGSNKGMGVVNMRERAALVGGSMEIESAAGRGVTIYIRVPDAGHEKGGGSDGRG